MIEQCVYCDGYGVVCSECDLSPDECECDDYSDWTNCKYCEGTGEASE